MSVDEIVDLAKHEASIYAKTGVDAVLVENMFDLPYLQGSSVGPEVVAVMTRVCEGVRKCIPKTMPCGIQILAGANHAALAVSKACNLQFIRAECFIFSHVADEGLMNACAGPLLRYRKTIGAENVLVFTDIKKKHSAHAITQDVTIKETASAAKFFLADGVIITGSATGEEADSSDLAALQSEGIPILIGSGVGESNVKKYMSAHGFIIGSHFKTNGKWQGGLEQSRIESFLHHFNVLK